MKYYRKTRRQGRSIIMTIPEEIAVENNIRPGDEMAIMTLGRYFCAVRKEHDETGNE